MRKTMLLLIIAVSVLRIYAQSPTITSVIATGLTGKTIHSHTAGSPSFTEGNSGANQTWDFSADTFSYASSSTYISPSTAYGYSSLPTCTDVISSNSGGTVSNVFDHVSSSVYAIIGLSQLSGGTGPVIVYDDYQDVYHFPMQMGTSFTDNFHGSADYGSGAALGRGGSITSTVDAYGTLKTPAGTFPNCLRIRSEQTISDTFYYMGQYTSDQQTHTVSYNWVSQSYPGLTLMNRSTGQGPVQAIDYAFYVDKNTTGIEEVNNEIQFSVFPNPAHNLVHLLFETPLEKGTISLYDMTGRQVISRQTGSLKETEISTNDLPAGLYVLKVISDNSISTRTVVVE